MHSLGLTCDAFVSSLWFVRHGSTAWSERERLQGSSPIGLSSDGVREAHDIGTRARQLGIASVCTSPLRRARATANIVAQYVRAPVVVIPALRELNYGAATGCTNEELHHDSPALAQAWCERPWQVRFAATHGALTDIAAMMQPMLTRGARSGTPTLCVTHGHVIRVALTLCERLAYQNFWQLDVPTASIWCVRPAIADDAPL